MVRVEIVCGSLVVRGARMWPLVVRGARMWSLVQARGGAEYVLCCDPRRNTESWCSRVRDHVVRMWFVGAGRREVGLLTKAKWVLIPHRQRERGAAFVSQCARGHE